MNKITTLVLLLIFFSCEKAPSNIRLSGPVFGTSYSVIYNSKINYQKQIDSLFLVVNNSMSTYQDDSYISKLNRNEDSLVDVHFIRVFDASKEIFALTDGAFDPTIGAVVNAWDFGPQGEIINLDGVKIDSLMSSVGLNQVKRVNNKVLKPKNTFIDFNAIAKGYGVDVIGMFLESKNVKNYLVEIGGEIRARGKNIEKEASWKIGIEMPNFNYEQFILEAIEIKDEAMATSGTYRKFKVDENGNKYAHIIDTKTGYPSKTNLLSVSVIAEDCMTADAYATAFKAMGIEKVIDFLKEHPELKAFLIYENDEMVLETITINGFPEKL